MDSKWPWLVVAAALVACGEPVSSVPEGGATLHVLFDERHGLEGGELVRLHDFDIGVVDSVDLSRGRVRATVSLSPKALANLAAATTFTVETDGEVRYLETHVLDPNAETLGEGASVDGADGNLELMAMRARSSPWWAKASELADDMRKELDAIDWTEEEKELRDQWEEIIEDLDGAAEDGREELGRRVEELTRKLEELGHSDEAQKLKERFETWLDELREEPQSSL